MPIRLEDRLRAARAALFVGREDEQALFQQALEAEGPPFSVLYVVASGGVGKTALLRAFERQCQAAGVPACYLDARQVDPAPQAFLDALAQALGLPAAADPLEAMAGDGGRRVLFIDTCEAIAGLDAWLRERFLPALPQQVIVVLAGRALPSKAWRADLGWQELVRVLQLRNLDAGASRRFLERRAVPEDQHEAVLSFTHGHPLATSLVADLLDQQPGAVFEPQQAPDVLQALLEQFVQHVPGPAHRAALEACALVRFTNEGTLRAMLDTADVHELFAWLRSLSFIDAGTNGLFPHDLAREVLAADLRWRNPEWHAELHRRARQFYTDRLKQASGRTDRQILSDYTFLHRHHPVVQPLFGRLRSQWAASAPLQTDVLGPGDAEALAALVARHEGDEAARIARHWMARQPEGVTVFRDGHAAPAGFSMTLALEATTAEDRAADPAAERAWQHLDAYAPLRAGERASLFRFWMARDAYQQVSPVQSLIFLGHVRHYLNTSGLAYTFLTCQKPAFWSTIFAFAGMTALPDVDFEVGDYGYAVFGHDWRAVPPPAWLDALAAHNLGDARPAGRPDAPTAPVVVLSRADFEEAVRTAFRAFARPGRLAGHPLLRARLITDEVGLDADEADRIEALRRCLETTSHLLDGDPRDARYFRALDATYLRPAPTQEQAAERLGLPFSTYRRHLKRGLGRVTELLWEAEVGTV